MGRKCRKGSVVFFSYVLGESDVVADGRSFCFWIVLILFLEFDVSLLLNDFWDADRQHVVERVQLLTNETLLVEKRPDDGPAVVLLNFLVLIYIQHTFFNIIIEDICCRLDE
eukprot:TRINITY_DN4937_c0_g3_i1.p2 TRINITY_DN4937_c0_g3~~TRINITY_DN4937_c0_g3_i1.p2  ORF type:complete len:112 (-),score=6.45 TRINITY_DN4937_c0_g3_i1:365-700(-)